MINVISEIGISCSNNWYKKRGKEISKVYFFWWCGISKDTSILLITNLSYWKLLPWSLLNVNILSIQTIRMEPVSHFCTTLRIILEFFSHFVTTIYINFIILIKFQYQYDIQLYYKFPIVPFSNKAKHER